jgi:hypothetical protein
MYKNSFEKSMLEIQILTQLINLINSYPPIKKKWEKHIFWPLEIG